MREEELSGVFPFWDKLRKNTKEILCLHTKHLLLSKGARIAAFESEYGCLFVRKGSLFATLQSEKETETELFRVGREGYCVIDCVPLCGRDIPELVFRTASSADVYAIDRKAFALLCTNNFFEQAVMRSLVSVVPVLINSIGQRDYFSLEKRIITVLLAESTRQRSNTLQLTHHQIASKIGSAREAVTRKLHEFAEEGLIVCQRGRVIIQNKEKLKRRSAE